MVAIQMLDCDVKAVCEVKSDDGSTVDVRCYDLFPHTERDALEGQQPRSCYIHVPHVRQSFNWDCGLACVLMVLRAVGIVRHDLKSLRALCPTTSIWSIDLAHLLRHFGLDVTLCTITIGANPHFATERFYAETMREDADRVTRLFHGAGAAGISVQQRSVPLRELQALLLSGRCVVVALVDKAKLLDPWCAETALSSAYEGLNSPPTYTGHYVVVCGYCADGDRFEVKDPASEAEALSLPSGVLEAARKSFGTDEDLLLLGVVDCPKSILKY